MKQAAATETSRLREGLLSFFFPPKCALCGKVGYFGLCPLCEAQLDGVFSPTRFRTGGGTGHVDAMFALFPYQSNAVRRLLFDWKQIRYDDLPQIFRPYLEKTVQITGFPRKIHAISYLPRRQRARQEAGFDQAEQIARLVAEILDVPMVPLLLRQGFSRPQHKASYEKREKNVRGVFRATRELAGEQILLIDDVVTTGATAREGARILKRAGAMKVFVLSLAH